jgi:hypothetical protein
MNLGTPLTLFTDEEKVYIYDRVRDKAYKDTPWAYIKWMTTRKGIGTTITFQKEIRWALRKGI